MNRASFDTRQLIQDWMKEVSRAMGALPGELAAHIYRQRLFKFHGLGVSMASRHAHDRANGKKGIGD